MGKKSGFTLVELSLSIAFIAILSITIALIINDAISTYRRGLTLTQVNTVGMDLVDDMRTVVQNSPFINTEKECKDMYEDSDVAKGCEDDGASNFVMVRMTAKVSVGGGGGGGLLADNVPVSGAFCTGRYSYVWNSGYFDANKVDNKTDRMKLAYTDRESHTVENFRLVKIRDEGRSVCKSVLKSNEYKVNSGVEAFNAGNVTEDPEIILANDSANQLALYDLVVAKPVSNHMNATFYSISFILGTVQGGINVIATGNFCATPDEYDSNFNYCAINKFNFAAQANGGK